MFEEQLTLIIRRRAPRLKDDEKMKDFNIIATSSLHHA